MLDGKNQLTEAESNKGLIIEAEWDQNLSYRVRLIFKAYRKAHFRYLLWKLLSLIISMV